MTSTSALVIYAFGNATGQVLAGWSDNEQDKRLFMVLGFCWPVALALAIILSPFIVTSILRSKYRRPRG